MDFASAEHFLTDQIPVSIRALIPAALKNAYENAAVLIRNEPILQIESAADNGGRIVSWSVDLAIRKLIESGQWTADYRWQNFAKPTGRYLEIRLSHSVLTVSQVSDAKRQPRNVVFRENSRLNNQTFFPLPEFDDERQIDGVPSLLLVHGYQGLTFAHFGVPNKVHKRGYIYRTPNLLLMPHLVTSDLPPVEQTDAEATMTLKEEIDRWRRDHGK